MKGPGCFKDEVAGPFAALPMVFKKDIALRSCDAVRKFVV